MTARPDEALAAGVGAAWSSRTPVSAGKVMVWLPLPMVKLCWTCGAAFQLVSPPWFALIVQRPTVAKVTEIPATVQTEVVADVKVTAKPDEAVALRASGD